MSCSEPRNPCLETQGLCGQHYCYRDPSNVKVGYRCACPPGFKPLSSTQPQCVNMNECVEYPDEACLNVGRCIDKDPSLSAIGIDMTEENLGYTCQSEEGWDSLHYRFLGVFILGDILEWTYSLQLSHKWTIKELLVFHSILLALLFVPLCLIIFGLAKMIQRILYEYKTKRSLE
ncbi:unnamed protein product [Trichobilharzia regenti]|nr:unnamed protein product [Trichobilharzia regenti]